MQPFTTKEVQHLIEEIVTHTVTVTVEPDHEAGTGNYIATVTQPVGTTNKTATATIELNTHTTSQEKHLKTIAGNLLYIAHPNTLADHILLRCARVEAQRKSQHLADIQEP